MDAGDKKMYIGVAACVGLLGLYAWRARCSKACPGAVDQMIQMKGAKWRYSTLAEVFSQFSGCKSCVEYAKQKLPTIVSSGPQHAETNTAVLAEVLYKHGMDA